MTITRVRTERERQAFWDLSRAIYPDRFPAWTPPLWQHYRQLMGSLADPERSFWVAWEGDRPVAHLGVKRHKGFLHFGFVECLEGRCQALRSLVEAAAVPGTAMRGPYHFRQEDPYTGLLVEGFDLTPGFMMPFHPPYYRGYLENCGFRPVQELHSYGLQRDTMNLSLMRERAARAREQGVRVRPMHPFYRVRDTRLLAAVFNQALAGNWGYEDFDEPMIREFVVLSLVLLRRDMVFFAELEGRTVGALITLPDLSPMLRRCRGRLTFRLLWDYLTRHRWVDGFRAYALGVLPEFRHVEVAGALVEGLMEWGRARPWRHLDASWVLRENHRMRAMLRALGARHEKTYLLMERPA